MIGKSEMAILLALEEDPLLPLKTVAERARLSWPTVKKKYTELHETNILRNPMAAYTPEVMDLERVVVFANIPTLNALQMVELACNEHPYTSYRVRTLHGKFGLFIQFNTPVGSRKNVKTFMDQLVEIGVVSTYMLYASSGRRKDFFPSLSKFDIKTMEWDFSWREWMENLHSGGRAEIERKGRLEDFDRIKKVHFDILRILTRDASMKQREISEELNLKKSTMNDHYRFVMNNLVSHIRLNYDRSRFNLSETYLLHIHDSKNLDPLISHILTDTPPFRLSVDLMEDKSMTMWANMSRSQFKEFSYAIWEEFPQTEFYQLNTSDEGAARYWFYPANFDFERHWWRDSQIYMVDDPINRVQRKLEVPAVKS